MSAILREKCRGALAAMLTPLTPDERLDVASCENLANALLDVAQPRQRAVDAPQQLGRHLVGVGRGKGLLPLDALVAHPLPLRL